MPTGKGSNVAEERRADAVPAGKGSKATSSAPGGKGSNPDDRKSNTAPAGKGTNATDDRKGSSAPAGKGTNATEDRKGSSAPAGKGTNATDDRKGSTAPAGKGTNAAEERKGSNAPAGKGAKATDERRDSKGPAAPEERRGSNARRDSNAAKRETFRPPWVKEGPDGLPPKPSNLWSQTRRSSDAAGDAPAGPRKPSVAKTDQAAQENGAKEHTFVKPQLKPVPPKEQTKLQSKEVKVPIKLNSVKDRPELQKPPLSRTGTITQEEKDVEKAVPTERNAIVRQESLKKFNTPQAPPMPPPAPAFPRSAEMKPLTISQLSKLEQLKNRPKVRPDWSGLLKAIETGQRLKHVECNDRSKPLLPKTKVDETDKQHFVYESEKSEKDTSHNQLLKQIQQGIHLKKVKTNDRSKPMLEGLRKFRRQMTIEEQIIKSQSMASIPPEEMADEADELDDIDKVRDDLQSTKQMLALELRNKEALGRENKRLQARLQQIEAELEKERNSKKAAPSALETDEKLLTSLKSEAADAKKTAQDLEKKFHDAADQLDHTKNELEEVRKQKLLLEKKLIESLQGGKRLSLSSKANSFAQSGSEDEEPESEDEGEDTPEKREKKAQRELRQLRNKLRNYKTKEDNAKKERLALKTQIKRLQDAIKEEKRKYQELQKEVTKMEAMMKEVGDSDDELEEEEEEEEEEEKKPEPEESESESETETSSESESESEKSVSESEDAPHEKKTANLGSRSSKHEGRLSALKKGNYMLKTTVERLQDDLNMQKEKTATLQQDLDSVLAELG